MIKIPHIEPVPYDLMDPEGKYVGTIYSNLEFLDVRVQIKEQGLEGYYVEKSYNSEGERHYIDKNGRYSGSPIFDEASEYLDKLLN